MLNFDEIAVEPELSDNGVWAEFLGGSFLLARPGEKYQARLVELYNQNLALVKSKTPEGDQKAQEIFKQCHAELVLLDWKDVVDKDGNEIPYTPEKGFALLKDPRQYEFVKFLDGFVGNRSNYQAKVEEEVAEDVKNSAVS